MILRLRVNDVVTVVEELRGPSPRSCRIQIECDDRTGAGFVLAQLHRAGIAQVPQDWLEIIEHELARQT